MATNKRKQPKYQFCYVWTSHSEQIDKLYRLDIDHKGIVPEDDKFDIYIHEPKCFYFLPSVKDLEWQWLSRYMQVYQLLL